MSDPGDPGDPSDPGDSGGPGGPATGGEPVGSLGEEAAKLFGVLADWARDQGDQGGEGDRGGQGSGQESGAGSAWGAWAGDGAGPTGLGEVLGDAVRRAEHHLGAGGAECRWCPLCQAVALVRHTSPEVRTHLTTAAGSLVQAAAALLATAPPDPGPPVERIDLEDESVRDEQDGDGER